MSYLSRLSARTRANVPLLLPKGLVNRQSPTIARAEETDEEETLAPVRPVVSGSVRRQEGGEDDELARAETGEETGEEPEAQRAGAAPQEEEPEAQRKTGAEEEEIAPVRRQQDDEVDVEARPMRTIARREEIPLEDTAHSVRPPAQADLVPGARAPDQDLAEDQDPENVRALHRDATPAPGNSLAIPAVSSAPDDVPGSAPGLESATPQTPGAAEFPENSLGSHFASQSFAPRRSETDLTSPGVTIDQLDVVIHEPAPPPGHAPAREDRSRAMRARYLRRM